MTVDHLSSIRTESARFAEVLAGAAPDARVPTCPDWTADDLLWHLTEVQWFWGTIVIDAPSDPDSVEPPPRPNDRAALLALFDDASSRLHAALSSADPADHRWTWSDDQTVAFILRRQAHEALIHRVDAELTAGAQRAAIDAALATDGIDEVLRVMFGGAPPWASARLDPAATLGIQAADLDRSWLVTLGTFSGTSPGGNRYDDAPFIEVAAAGAGHEDVAAAITGTAADLDCWLWGRPPLGPIDRHGDATVLDGFAELIADGVE